MDRSLLVVNAGSSSVKFALFVLEAGGAPALRYRGQAEGIKVKPRLEIKAASGTRLLERELPATADQEAALGQILEWLDDHLRQAPLLAAGHRIVHGGPHYAEPLRLTPKVMTALEGFIPLAPLHQPHNLKAVRAVQALRPDLPQVACFDTAFHRHEPWQAQWYALPREYAERGVLRYGFHGLSYENIAEQLRTVDPQAERVIVAHLGNGASMCAMHGGRSVATTMGFTALEGLPMGQRCGSIDPGVVLYLLENDGMTPAEVTELLYKRSGLLGVSGGLSSDMRALLASDSEPARQAVELYCYRAVREIGSLAAALGGLDALVFTAGIGENAAVIRERICQPLAWLGVQLDPVANKRHGPLLSTDASGVRVWCLRTDEESVIARQTLNVLDGGSR